MKKELKNIFDIAGVYIGAIIGAGFASGQEIMQFFVVYGYKGMYGVALSGIIFALIGAVILNKIFNHKITNYSEYIKPLIGERLSRCVEVISCLFMGISFCIMVAGSGALLYEEFNLAYNWGIYLMALLCLIVFLFDLKGVVVINGVLSPIMITGIVLLGSHILIFKDIQTFSMLNILHNIVNNWFWSSLIYVSYNTLTIVPIMTAVYPLLTKRSVAIFSGLIGGISLGIAALIMWLVLFLHYSDVLNYEIPFLKLVMDQSKAMEWIYVFILFSAMFTTAVSNGFGFLNQIKRWRGFNKGTIFIFCGLSIPLAYLGFSKLVGILYPFFGYVGFFMIMVILLDGVRELFRF